MVIRLSAVLVAFFFAAAVSPERAPEFRKSDAWINSPPLTLKSLQGKVIVLDFWAFDCAPCIEAMPHVLELEKKYASKGVILIGIHTPRTDEERNVSNVRKAVARMGIRYPVVIDTAHKIFDDYRCDLWPTQFVIDGRGTIRYVHGGVGRYEELDTTIRNLLSENQK